MSTKDYSDTEINADTLAAYILEHPGGIPIGGRRRGGYSTGRYARFANHEADRWGVVVINEQTQYPRAGRQPHLAPRRRRAALRREDRGRVGEGRGVRRLNWATYWVDDDGKNQYPRDDNWLTDGYGDFVRHFIRAMASDPHWRRSTRTTCCAPPR